MIKPVGFLLAGLLAVPAIASAQTGARTVLVPGGTQVPVHVLGSISSGGAKIGETFTIQAASDVVVNGYVVIRKGAQGEGTIGRVDQAGGNGRSGAMQLTFNYIYAVDGGKIRLSDATQKQAEEDRKGASSTATIIGFATFGIGGLFGHNLAHGRNVTIDESKTLSSFVADTVHVVSSETSRGDHYDR